MALAISSGGIMGWNSEKYFVKAQRYWERTTTAGRDAELFLLQMSFVVEFVVRGTLVSRHPSLNADLSEETLLFANGEKPNKPPTSIGMDKAIQRVQRLIPEISAAEVQAARLLFETRNEELHGDNDALASVRDASLKPQILSFIVKLTKFAGQNIDTLLGRADAQQAVATSQALAKNRKDRVSDLIRISKDRFLV